MQKWLVVAAIVACGCRDKAPTADWKPRTGPGFEVTAPFPAVLGKREIVPGTDMISYEYGGGGATSLQVMTTPLPKDRSPLQAVQVLRDHIASVGTITREDDVALGDALGKDVRYTATLPQVGAVVARTRLLIQNGVIYQVQAMRSASWNDPARDGSRFIESFHFTEASKGMPPVHIVSGAPDAEGWYTGHSPNGFSIRAPNQINEGTREDAGKHYYILATLKMPERIKVSAMCIVEETPKTKADILRDTSNVEAHRDRMASGREALEVDADGNASYMFVFDGKRSCVLTVAPYSKSMPRQSALAAKFFDSFAFDP